jgi:hypothetical protein
LLLSLAAHVVVALLIWRAPRWQPAAPLNDTLEIDVFLPPPATETLGPPAPPPAAESPAGPADGSRSRSRPRPAPPVAPPPAGTPDRPVAPAGTNPSWLRMRSPVESSSLLRTPPVAEAPAAPARDSLGLPIVPLPDVIHHPIEKRAQGNTRTSTGLGVKVDAEGGIAFKDPGGFDLNHLAERMAGNDSYSHEKRRVAAATFEERFCLAEAAALQRQHDGLFHLKGRLEKLMQLQGLSGAQRREILFEMWDECLDGAADGQPDFGAAARATILAFIRRAMPAGSGAAFTPAELTALNLRRVSRSLFDPYGTLGRPDAGAAPR